MTLTTNTSIVTTFASAAFALAARVVASDAAGGVADADADASAGGGGGAAAATAVLHRNVKYSYARRMLASTSLEIKTEHS